MLLLKPQASVTEAVSVTGWRCTESRPELETVNKEQPVRPRLGGVLVFSTRRTLGIARVTVTACKHGCSKWHPCLRAVFTSREHG